MQKKPLPWCSFGSYAPFSSYWWGEVLSYVTGIYLRSALVAQSLRTQRVGWDTPGWWSDLNAIYHRARYGWAPRDQWNMHTHLEKVLSEMLFHFADTTHSYAPMYPSSDAWSAQLREWATDLNALEQFEQSDEYLRLIQTSDYETITQTEARLRGRRNAALEGLIESWDHLWS